MGTAPTKTALGRIRAIIVDPRSLAMLPAISFAVFAAGGVEALLGFAIVAPLVVFACTWGAVRPSAILVDARTELTNIDGVANLLEQAFDHDASLQTAALSICIDDLDAIGERYGTKTQTRVQSDVVVRIRGMLRDGDAIAYAKEDEICIALRPVKHLGIETCIQIAKRMQDDVAHPNSVDGHFVSVTISVGFALSARLDAPTADKLLAGAASAMTEARRNGPSAIRSYTKEMDHLIAAPNELAQSIQRALDEGEITAYFQPQVTARAGDITGFEALARWEHPEHGTLPPSDFLSIIHTAGLSERLSEVMLFQSLAALRAWDDAGLNAPLIGVNFSTAELQNPKLVEKVKWELDRFDLTPDRLCIEILETVFSNETDGTVIRNISGLSELGCRIDLDDFGTGNASIAHIQKLKVDRIKIDRLFVARLDEDAQQKQLVQAILTMANQLGVDTLAEGVETVGEHSTLAKIGCGHVQGFGIARPMPFAKTLEWIQERQDLTQKVS